MLQQNAFQDQFVIRRLIFVNSAAYAYTEIRVDQHTALFGRNNLGKTSMLNALKLFLLPEENFRRCERKFGFKGANGKEYDGPESYLYYFPEDHSFIILEAENVHGLFCLVLHRGSREFSYGRMAVPEAYDPLRSLFWDVHSDENEGLGAPVPHLHLKGVLSELALLGGEDLGDVKTIKERLFSERPLDPNQGRFCLLPLKQGGTQREIDAWRQLIHLAFDIAARDEQTLPNAIATIIEGEKQRDAEQVAVDFDEILKTYHQLKEEGDRLQNLQNHRPVWERVEADYDFYQTASREAAQEYVNLGAALAQRLSSASGEREKLEAQRQDRKRLYDANRQQYRDLEGQLKEASGQRKVLEKSRDDVQSKLERIARIAADFPDYFDNDQLIDALKGHLDDLQETCEGLQSQEGRQVRMETLVMETRQQQESIRRYKGLLEHQQGALLEQLDADASNVLLNLNSAFASLKVELGVRERNALQGFVELFQASEQGLRFLGQPLTAGPLRKHDAERQRQDWEYQLNAAEVALRKAEKELQTLNDLGRQPQTVLQQKLKEAEHELQATRSDIERVKAYSTLYQQSEEVVQTLEDLARREHGLKEGLASLAGAEDSLHRQWSSVEQQVRDLEASIQDWRQHQSDLESIKNTHAPILDAWVGTLKPQPGSPVASPVEPQQVSGLKDQCLALKACGERLREGMATLLRAGLLEDTRESAFQALSFGELRQFRDRFKREFDTLEVSQHNYREQVRAHNKETSIKMDELKGAAQQIRTFVQEVNQEFKGYPVSNLAEIQVCLTLHPRFEQLLKDLESINFHTDQLHEARLYDRLNDFCEEFFQTAGGRAPTLRMDQIIRQVCYRYRLEGQSQFDDKEQSNGTTSMVNSLLLSILIKRLLRSDARICLPLVMDEMGSLDRENLKTAARIAQSHGFVLFGASPDISSEIVMAVHNYVNLGAFRATTSSYSERRRVVYHSHCERLYAESEAG